MTGLRFSTARVTNIAPVRASAKRTFLEVSGSRSKLVDLSPLKGMPLKQLWLDYQPERDAEVLWRCVATPMRLRSRDRTRLRRNASFPFLKKQKTAWRDFVPRFALMTTTAAAER